jgi:hypothetical protein
VKKKYLKPWLFGIIAGVMVVCAEAFLRVYPPAAYAFCLTCHTRDLVNSFLNAVFHTQYPTAVIARRMIMLTSPAVMLGAFVAARVSGEYTTQKSTRPLFYFLFGFFVMIAGIIIFGCPTRIVVRSGYGDVYGLIALAGMFIGIWNGTVIMRSQTYRGL